MAEEHTGTIDLLLTDVIMPRLGGRELAKRLWNVKPRLPVIFMSGYAGDVLTDEGELPPGAGFIQKPFAPQYLVEKVAEAMEAARRG